MTLNELQKQLAAKRAEVKALFDSAKNSDGKTVMTQDQLAEVEAKKAEIETINGQIREVKASQIERPAMPIEGKSRRELKSLGEAVEGVEFKAGQATVVNGIDFKATFTRSAGLAPERRRNGDFVPALRPELNLFDVLSVQRFKGDAVTFVRQTLTTGAGAVAENGTYGEANMTVANVEQPAKKVGVILPVTDEVLADNEGLEDWLTEDLSDLLLEKFENDFLVADGTSNTMTGLTNTSSVNTYARGDDDVEEGIYEALVRGASKIGEIKAGKADLFIISQADFTAMRLQKTEDGHFVWPELALPGGPTIDGKAVLISHALAAGAAIALDRRHVKIGVREDAEIEVGYNGTDFGSGRKSLRGTMRGVPVIRRPQAICVIDTSEPA